ncbi:MULTISPECIES: right-handed parallel beta-helix repeat-containing protein [Dyadobacter]|uniref:Right-handed parallel beta-helix repeat-containing protein n=1 Tax=Dyadobacter chenhuakuii TaxID=2909339 RepID=A0A9X1QDC5_9BACT|nr:MULTISPECIES: right-handed parallel beta-helix repeat-containing protein [Dyadobacter]MCE7073104.1 right-handed parallel beta-helix repeat-containing protein [Dyadobacter sp. CY327]MCF2499026.1 right-handed parallel beta-helix repeat-containing protein [Dyadobacter chenhuakuii]MCF2517650.1 right-handed parallel beta-helix repeat-containing protein [Dyadobacter sp. CY351]
MKNTILAAGLAIFALASCSDDDTEPTPVVPPVVEESVSGEVSGVWTKGGTYKITGHIQVPAGKSLTIEEGVTVLFSDSVVKPEVVVLGNLYSLGTAAAPVKFTVPDAWKTPGNQFGNLWGGLVAGPNTTELVLSNTILEYGGAVTTEESPSVKAGLYKAEAGEHVPVAYFMNINGKFIVVNSTIRNFNEDGFYIEGGKVIIANNMFYTTGVSGGDAINIKSGVQADVAFNVVYSPNTNALKLSNSGERTPQAYVVGYNNTIVNAGWRRPTTKGGSIWVESGVRADLYNNLLANDRYGIKRDAGDPEDARSVIANTFYYGADQTTTNQFQPSAEIVKGANDLISAKAGENDPKFVNYPLTTAMNNAAFNTQWDFHLQAGSPALGKGKTDFTRLYAEGLLVNGVTYKSPAPASFAGAFGTK